MEFIRPSFEIWEQNYDNPIEDMYKHIAQCTRVCYQSEKKNNGETDEDFVKRVILRKEPWSSEANHLAMLEHGTVYLIFDCIRKEYLDYHGEEYCNNPYSKVNVDSNEYDSDVRVYYITTNLRVLIENDWLEDLKYICAPTEHHSRRVTVSFTTNIGVSREFNRHRVDSIAEESTRYCNYHSDKFNNSITFCLPSWVEGDEVEILACRTAEVESGMYADMRTLDNIDWNAIDWYLYALSTAAFAYKNLIRLGWKPQKAREVLPLATKTQLVHTAFIDDWKHFFKLRAEGVSGAPHPNAAFLAIPLFEEFKKRNYV